jgi:hypothetical protein
MEGSGLGKQSVMAGFMPGTKDKRKRFPLHPFPEN